MAAIEPIEDLIREAWALGKTLDLSGIGYGRVHWGNRTDVLDDPTSYYFFLAGLVRRHGMTRILELGTHWGGATRAMHKGIEPGATGKIVTVDITTESDNRLEPDPSIVKLVGDCNGAKIFERVLRHFGGEPIDMIYIDAAHQTMPVFVSYAIYTMALKPRFVVFDDITLDDGMRKAWDFIRSTVPPGDAANAAEVDRAIRPPSTNPGFGVVRLRDRS